MEEKILSDDQKEALRQEHMRHVINLLNQYAVSIKALDDLIDDLNERKDALISDAIREETRNLDAEFKPKIEAGGEHLAMLKRAIKETATVLGAGASGAEYSVQFRKGADKVDVAGLKGYGLEHPEVLKLISQEEPTIAIVKNRTKTGKQTD